MAKKNGSKKGKGKTKVAAAAKEVSAADVAKNPAVGLETSGGSIVRIQRAGGLQNEVAEIVERLESGAVKVKLLAPNFAGHEPIELQPGEWQD